MHGIPALAFISSVPWWATGIMAFFGVFVAEVLWVLCVRWTAQGLTLRTAVTGSFMVLLGWVDLIVLLGVPYVAIPCEMIGAFVGVLAAMRLDKWLERDKTPEQIGSKYIGKELPHGK